MLVHLINFPDREKYDLSCLEVINSGGAPLPNEVRAEFERLYKCRVLDGYGLSECAPTATSYHSKETIRPCSIGHPIPGVTVTIQDESGSILAPGQVGEICIQGPNVMHGYLKDDAATREALRGGWLHSGDIGYMDDDGYVFLTDRKKDLIIKGGENISPREIEEALYTHPAVREVVVVGIPDPTYGENIAAFVALKEGKSATEEELRAHCAAAVTKFKLPALILFRDDLPKNANGKLDRKILRRELAEQRTRATA
jgi:long-chain acyl-CoA synthetase